MRRLGGNEDIVEPVAYDEIEIKYWQSTLFKKKKYAMWCPIIRPLVKYES